MRCTSPRYPERRGRGARSARALLLGLLTGFLAAGAAGSAHAQIDLAGTTWEAVGDYIQRYRPNSSRLVQGLNGRTIFDSVTYFGPISDPPLADDEFLLVVSDGSQGFEITGTYTDDNPRKPKLDVDEAAAAQSIGDFIQGQWEAVALIQPQQQPVTTIVDFRRLKVTLKTKVNNGLDRIKARVKTRGTVRFVRVGDPPRDVPGVAGEFRFLIKYTGKGFLVDVEEIPNGD